MSATVTPTYGLRAVVRMDRPIVAEHNNFALIHTFCCGNWCHDIGKPVRLQSNRTNIAGVAGEKDISGHKRLEVLPCGSTEQVGLPVCKILILLIEREFVNNFNYFINSHLHSRSLNNCLVVGDNIWISYKCCANFIHQFCAKCYANIYPMLTHLSWTF